MGSGVEGDGVMPQVSRGDDLAALLRGVLAHGGGSRRARIGVACDCVAAFAAEFLDPGPIRARGVELIERYVLPWRVGDPEMPTPVTVRAAIDAPRPPRPPRPPRVDENDAVEEQWRFRLLNPATPRAVEQPPIVDGLLYPGLTVLSGPPKRFKSWLALALTHSVSAGVPFLDRESPRPLLCGWVQADMAEAAFQRYSDQIGVGHRIPPDCPMVYWAPGDVDLCDARDLVRLRAEVSGCGVDLLVIDSGRAVSSVDENDSREVRAFVRGALLRIRDELGVSVILVMHAPKGARGVRGSGEWAAAADSLWVVSDAADGADGADDDEIVRLDVTGRHASTSLHFRLVSGAEGDSYYSRIEEVDRGEAKIMESVDRYALAQAVGIVSSSSSSVSRTELLAALDDRGVTLSRREAAGLCRALATASSIKETRVDRGARVETRYESTNALSFP